MAWDLWIDGKWTPSRGSDSLKVENPATGEIVDEVVDASAEDVDAAVGAAREAFFDGRWSKATPAERGKGLAQDGRPSRREGRGLCPSRVRGHRQALRPGVARRRHPVRDRQPPVLRGRRPRHLGDCGR